MKEFNSFKIINLVALLLTLCCLSSINLSQGKIISSLDEKREAEKTWEALIKTKGGREKLHSITNMLTELSDFTRLNIFPTISWDFGYYPVTNAPGVRVYDGNKLIVYSAIDGGATTTGEMTDKDVAALIAYDQIPFLLETKWSKPEPIRVTRIKRGKKYFDVIETRFENERMDFVFEPEETLVTEVDFYNKQGRLWRIYSLSDYTEISGIKMPRIWGLKDGYSRLDKEKFDNGSIKFTFNVEYDPHLFDLPVKATTPDAWKPQKPTN